MLSRVKLAVSCHAFLFAEQVVNVLFEDLGEFCIRVRAYQQSGPNNQNLNLVPSLFDACCAACISGARQWDPFARDGAFLGMANSMRLAKLYITPGQRLAVPLCEHEWEAGERTVRNSEAFGRNVGGEAVARHRSIGCLFTTWLGFVNGGGLTLARLFLMQPKVTAA